MKKDLTYEWALQRKIHQSGLGGASLQLTLPRGFVQAAGLKHGDEVKVLFGKKVLTITK